MCRKCGHNKCACEPDISQFIDQVNNLDEIMNEINSLTMFLRGHPIIAIDDPEDIAMFDLTTGIGSKNWLGWGVCNGTQYKSPKGLISTPDMRDRFLTGYGGTYAVGDTGGSNKVTLAVNELPVHNHTLTDPGHTHTVTDPGHTHTVTDIGHTHNIVGTPHQHSFTTELADGLAGHTHSYQDHQKNNIYITGANGAGGVIMVESLTSIPGSIQVGDDNDHSDTRTTAPASAATHFHTGTTDQTTQVNVAANTVTGVTNQTNTTGVTNQTSATGISSASVGAGVEHENRPPFYACIFIKKIF